MAGRHEKNNWQRRLELLKSLDLTRVAEEVNAQRLADLREKIARAGPRERRKMSRLVTLYEAGQLVELPSDRRANPQRMKRVLIALHMALGDHPRITRTVPDIAAKVATLGRKTAYRGLYDLRDACLIDVAPKARARRRGGQGPNEYFMVWSTLRDLAAGQGLQGELFDFDLDTDHSESEDHHSAPSRGDENSQAGHPESGGRSGREKAPGGTQGRAGSVIEEHSRPDESSGRSRPHGLSQPPAESDCVQALGHSGQALGHSGQALPHSVQALRPRAGIGSLSCPTGLNKSSSPSLRLVYSRPAQEGGRGSDFDFRKALPGENAVDAKQTTHGEQTTHGGWAEVERRLREHGLGSARVVARRDAPAAGWSAEQVLRFLDWLERETAAAGGEAPWEPGPIWYHLAKSGPDGEMTIPRREAHVRARRDRDRQRERERQAAQRADERRQSERQRSEEREREQRFGPRLDAMSRAEQCELLARHQPEIKPQIGLKNRWLLLRLLEREVLNVEH